MSPEEVPDELVELAAHAFHWSYAERFPDAPPADYASLPASLRERYEQMARHGLAAALPVHEAAVLDEMGEALEAVPDYAASDYDRGRVAQRHDDAEALFTRAAAAKP